MSRLEEIEAIEQEVANGFEIEDLNLNTMTVVNREHFDWLKEQAERFEVLSEQHDEALMQNKRYREALEFYANKKTYRYYKESYIDLLKDGGYIARKALEGGD